MKAAHSQVSLERASHCSSPGETLSVLSPHNIWIRARGVSRLLSIVLVATAALSRPACAEDHVALFKNVTGKVSVLRKGGSVEASPGMELFKSDEVVSGAGSSGGIVFEDGTLLTLGSSSEVVIRDYVFEPRESKYAFSAYLRRGTAIYSSGKIGKLSPQSVIVETPKAVVGVRGTRFIITAEPSE